MRHLLLLTGLVLALPALADIGPKTSIAFHFQDAAQPAGGRLLECQAADCSDAKPMSLFRLKRFSCKAHDCFAVAYGFTPVLKLEAELNGRTLRSKPFAYKISRTDGFMHLIHSDYVVRVEEGHLIVTPAP
jgi:hypothetical protein